MNWNRTFRQALFSGTLLFGVTVAAAPVNNGGGTAGMVAVPATASAVVNPFKGECAALTKARFSAFYNRGGGLSCGFGDSIGQSKNLEDFTSPETGIFCFKPSKKSGLYKSTAFARAMPTVTIEWSTSSGVELLAYPVQPHSTISCPAGYLEVRAYDFSGGAAVPTNNASFYVMVI